MKLGTRWAGCVVLAGAVVGLVWGCGGSSDESNPFTPDGGDAAAGSSSGGSSAGGSSAGGSSAGGSSAGGSSAGGSDGSSAGGSSAGGSSAGGSSAGGSSAGGSSAGGSSAGGSAGSSAGGSSAGGSAGSSTGGSSGATGGTGATSSCGTTQCTNCKDDDGDGKIDAADQQCTGAADNDEASYGTGIPGDNQDPKWQDCFFDGDSGAGNDGCRYHTDCLTGAKPPSDPDCIVSQACIKYCMAATPNGCDCFGCCTLPTSGSSTVNVRLSPDCTPATINDPAKCVPCKKSTTCNNDCGHCELCLGKTTLPPDCGTGGTGGTGTGGTGGTTGGTGGTTGGTGGTTGGTGGAGGSGGVCVSPICPAGVRSCGVACLPACPTGTFCLTGCCTAPPP